MNILFNSILNPKFMATIAYTETEVIIQNCFQPPSKNYT